MSEHSDAMPSQAGRQLVHLRQVELTAFVRDDGLWDLEVTLADRKSRVFAGGAGDHPAGSMIHGMRLALTVDTQGNILGVAVDMSAVPYADSCTGAAGEYKLLVGLNLLSGFKAGLRQRIAQRNGCSHLSELAALLPTLAIQSFADIVYPVRDNPGQLEPSSAIDGCHGLRTDGEAIRLYYPRWYKPSG